MTKRHGLIADRVVFASKVDYTQCPDVQQFIKERVNYEAFLEDCRREAKRELLPDTDRSKISWKDFIQKLTAIIP